jgi:spore germination cell wall hydrolase CwlJ-like protein
MALLATAGATLAAAGAGGFATARPSVASSIAVVLRLPAPTMALERPQPILAGGTAADALEKMAREHRCLSEVIYFEARGESEAGQIAVADVIFARLAGHEHGDTLCAVIYEGAGQTFCQFTFACDGSLDRPRAAAPWRAAQILAARIMAGQAPRSGLSATYYHSLAVRPSWIAQMQRVGQIGNHIFYRAAPVLAALRGPQL